MHHAVCDRRVFNHSVEHKKENDTHQGQSCGKRLIKRVLLDQIPQSDQRNYKPEVKQRHCEKPLPVIEKQIVSILQSIHIFILHCVHSPSFNPNFLVVQLLLDV